ncbi:hypothetical protein WJX81_004104 [Elliptochloris bilobata]|uniref:Band 7 domain-containing protein n=1 Tax=Elliptochloris bilobata TaxID=381761 RepID=A0AAW1RKV0_9CHLO
MGVSCFTCPSQSSVAVIERFGRFNRFAHAGLNWINPFCGESVAGALSLRVQQLDVAIDTKTKDNVFVRMVVSVQYQVVDSQSFDNGANDSSLKLAFYKLTNPHRQITSYVFDVVRAVVPKIDLDNVFIAKEEIAKDVQDTLTKSMASFGYQIIQTLVTDIEPDSKVRVAMNEINAAVRQRAAALEKAEAEKIMVVKKAEASAEAKFLEGQGIARQRQAIVNGLRESVTAFGEDVKDVSSRDVLELMLLTQYCDMLNNVGARGGNSTVFLNSSPGAMAELGTQMRTAFMQAAAGSQNIQSMKRD